MPVWAWFLVGIAVGGIATAVNPQGARTLTNRLHKAGVDKLIFRTARLSTIGG